MKTLEIVNTMPYAVRPSGNKAWHITLGYSPRITLCGIEYDSVSSFCSLPLAKERACSECVNLLVYGQSEI